MIMSMKILDSVIRNTRFDGKVFLAGGAVRDSILGLPVKDSDFVVIDNGLMGGLECATYVAKVRDVWKDGSNPVLFPTYGTAKLDLRGCDMEFVAPRIETYSADSRKPTISLGSLSDDAMRRDFTVNSLFIRVGDEDDIIVDPTGRGLRDLHNKILDTTDDPFRIFSEDPLRMLRAFRFAAKYNFNMTDRVADGIRGSVGRMAIVSKERIRDEFCKILALPKPSAAFYQMLELGFLEAVFPDIFRMVGVTQNEYHIHDVFGHTMAVVDAALITPDLSVRIGALLHDIGKPATRTVVEKNGVNKVQFLGHADIGSRIASNFMTDLKFSNDMISKVRRMVFYHMDLKSAGPDGSKMSDVALRKFVHRVGNVSHIYALLELMDADNVSHAEGHNMPNQILGISNRLEEMDLLGIINTKPILDGHRLKELGATGSLIGKITKRLITRQLENVKFDENIAINLVKNMVKDAEAAK